MNESRNSSENIDSQGYFNTYLEYNKTLRVWLATCGIGGPALLISGDALRAQVLKNQKIETIIICFLAGVCAQILGTFINKYANWYLYHREMHPNESVNWISRSFHFISDMIIIDIAIDISTIILYSVSLFYIVKGLRL